MDEIHKDSKEIIKGLGDIRDKIVFNADKRMEQLVKERSSDLEIFQEFQDKSDEYFEILDAAIIVIREYEEAKEQIEEMKWEYELAEEEEYYGVWTCAICGRKIKNGKEFKHTTYYADGKSFDYCIDCIDEFPDYFRKRLIKDNKNGN